MRRLSSHLIGVDQGSTILFSDFEHDGVMWSGSGARVTRKAVTFSESFRAVPIVFASVDMWDYDQATNLRGDLQAEAITAAGFELVFRTWGDTRVARLRASWMALGEVRGGDEWQVD